MGVNAEVREEEGAEVEEEVDVDWSEDEGFWGVDEEAFWRLGAIVKLQSWIDRGRKN